MKSDSLQLAQFRFATQFSQLLLTAYGGVMVNMIILIILNILLALSLLLWLMPLYVSFFYLSEGIIFNEIFIVFSTWLYPILICFSNFSFWKSRKSKSTLYLIKLTCLGLTAPLLLYFSYWLFGVMCSGVRACI
jgi:hypothetical protein